METCKATEATQRFEGMPQKNFEVTPSRMPANALLENRIQIAFIVDLYAEKEN